MISLFLLVLAVKVKYPIDQKVNIHIDQPPLCICIGPALTQ